MASCGAGTGSVVELCPSAEGAGGQVHYCWAPQMARDACGRPTKTSNMSQKRPCGDKPAVNDHL